MLLPFSVESAVGRYTCPDGLTKLHTLLCRATTTRNNIASFARDMTIIKFQSILTPPLYHGRTCCAVGVSGTAQGSTFGTMFPDVFLYTDTACETSSPDMEESGQATLVWT